MDSAYLASAQLVGPSWSGPQDDESGLILQTSSPGEHLTARERMLVAPGDREGLGDRIPKWKLSGFQLSCAWEVRVEAPIRDTLRRPHVLVLQLRENRCAKCLENRSSHHLLKQKANRACPWCAFGRSHLLYLETTDCDSVQAGASGYASM